MVIFNIISYIILSNFNMDALDVHNIRVYLVNKIPSAFITHDCHLGGKILQFLFRRSDNIVRHEGIRVLVCLV